MRTLPISLIALFIVSLFFGSMSNAVAALHLDDLFRTDRVVKVEINVETDDWDTLRSQSREFFEALGPERRLGPVKRPYSYVEADVVIDGVKLDRVGIRKKGFLGSQSSSRPSLKIKLDFTDKDLEIDGLNVLTLNNNSQDPGILNQYLGYRAFRNADVPASRCSLVHVTVNGENLGIYSHVESIKKPMLEREFGDDSGVLYEGTIVDFHTGWELGFERKFGKDKKGRKKIAELIELVNQEDEEGSGDWEEQFGKLVDLSSFYTFWGMESLLGHWDGYAGNSNNYFFYLNPKTDRFHFIPWGADALFVEKGKFDRDPKTPISVRTLGLLTNRLYRSDSCRKRYEVELRRLLAEFWNEDELIAELKRANELIAPYVNDEQKRPERKRRRGPAPQGKDGLKDRSLSGHRIQRFIETRRERLLEEIADGMPEWNQPPREPIIVDGSQFGGKKKWSKGGKEILEAARSGKVETIENLVAKGVSINEKDRMGTTPLGLAVLFNHSKAVQKLIQLGADPNLRGPDGSVAVQGAAFFGLEDSLKALIEGGADLNMRNAEGLTALDIAAAPWNEEIEEMMKFVGGMFKMELDTDKIQLRRPELVAYLKSKGGKLSGELVEPKPALRE